MADPRESGTLAVCADAVLDHKMTAIDAHVDPVAEERYDSTTRRQTTRANR
jgi:hypothetical protein